MNGPEGEFNWFSITLFTHYDDCDGQFLTPGILFPSTHEGNITHHVTQTLYVCLNINEEQLQR